jgi:CheY-like chemotaxis protein
MKILIVEDDELKLNRVREFTQQISPDIDILQARSFKSGLRMLVAESFDFVILDMTLPNFDNSPGKEPGRPHNLGGRELLRQMRRRSIVVPVVVLTQFDVFPGEIEPVTLDQLRTDLKQDFPAQFVEAVFYQATTDDWKRSLHGYINDVRTAQ